MLPLLILSGPTGVGKTALSIELAKRLDAEIISADSMQVYRGMDIGSAKIAPDEMQGVPHHLLDILEPTENFDVHTFQRLSKAAMQEIYARGKLPFLVGGTGFYIQSVLYDIDFTAEENDFSYRAVLERRAENEGVAALYTELERVDAASAAAIHPNNVKRVIRALEYHHLTGGTISEHNRTEREKSSPYAFAYFVLTAPRELLYANIERRVDAMVANGLVEEVARLKAAGCDGSCTAMQGLGYKEILGYLDGEYDLERAVYLIKRETRHFAKRQLTWYRREKEVVMLDKTEFADDAALMERMITVARSRGVVA